MGVNWTKFTEWKNTGAEPSSTLKQSGFQGGYKPPASVFNYFFNRASVCIAEIQSVIDTLKNKLDGVATNAEVNQNAFTSVKVGSSTISADSKTDTLELVAGNNVTIDTDATNDKVTITAKDTTYGIATSSASGLMSSTDKAKLDGMGYTCGTDDLTAGSSALETGKLYFVYEN